MPTKHLWRWRLTSEVTGRRYTSRWVMSEADALALGALTARAPAGAKEFETRLTQALATKNKDELNWAAAQLKTAYEAAKPDAEKYVRTWTGQVAARFLKGLG